MEQRKKVLLIATGGTIASGYTEEGLAPQLAAEKLLQYVEGYRDFCSVDVTEPFSLDSTNIYGQHWLELAGIIEENFAAYDGFVICHGTDTMAFTAAALSYLVQGSNQPSFCLRHKGPWSKYRIWRECNCRNPGKKGTF